MTCLELRPSLNLPAIAGVGPGWSFVRWGGLGFHLASGPTLHPLHSWHGPKGSRNHACHPPFRFKDACPGLLFTRCDRQDFIPCPTFHAHSCSVLRPWIRPFHTATFAQFRRPSSLNPRPCLRATRGRTKIRAAHEHLGREKGRGSRGGKGRSTPRLEAETLY